MEHGAQRPRDAASGFKGPRHPGHGGHQGHGKNGGGHHGGRPWKGAKPPGKQQGSHGSQGSGQGSQRPGRGRLEGRPRGGAGQKPTRQRFSAAEWSLLASAPFDPSALRPVAGVLWPCEEGWGELRRASFDYASRSDDILVPPEIARRHAIERGSAIVGRAAAASAPGAPERLVLREVSEVDGLAPDHARRISRIPFKERTCIDPLRKFRLAAGTRDPSLRLIDLLTPLGKGQRGLIVAPPRTGKTILLQKLARAIVDNHPEVHVIVLLVDERPEEATDWKRSVRGEVLSSTSDEMAATHVAIAEIVIERAKRLVELGKDVVILFDSLTRLGRAYNHETRNSGRTLSGGVDARTLEKPKAFFGAARNTEEGGSLTIIATALIETGSRMDEVIFEEFKGTGNMELVLSRKLADFRIFPSIDVHLSGTRKEEKLLDPGDLSHVWGLRRVLQNLDPADGMRLLVKKIEATETNEEFFSTLLKER